MIQAVNGKLLRLRGALGPLHCEALTGTLSVQLTPVATGEGTGRWWRSLMSWAAMPASR